MVRVPVDLSEPEWWRKHREDRPEGGFKWTEEHKEELLRLGKIVPNKSVFFMHYAHKIRTNGNMVESMFRRLLKKEKKNMNK